MTKLEKYVLTYRNDMGKIVCNLEDYYQRCVKPLGEKFSHFYLGINQMAICPLHDDHDPSLGLIRDKNLKDVYIYHCFGCGRTGNIIRFHQFIEHKYHNKDLSEQECCQELMVLFSIPEPDDDDLADDDYEGIYALKSRKIDKFGRGYSFKDFNTELLDIRKHGNGGIVNLDLVNNACIKMIATEKRLYER